MHIGFRGSSVVLTAAKNMSVLVPTVAMKCIAITFIPEKVPANPNVVIEEKIEIHLGEILNINGHFDEIQQNIEKSQVAKSGDLVVEKAGLEKRAAQLAKDLERLFELQLNSEGLAQELFQERLAKLGHERKGLETLLSELAEQIEERKDRSQDSSRIRSRVEEFQRGWKKATPAEKKRLGRRVLARLIPSERGVEVFYFTDGSGLDSVGGEAATAAEKTKRQDLSLASVGSDIMKIGWGFYA